MSRMNIRETLIYTWQLLKDTFNRASPYREEIHEFELNLGTRAWLIHIIVSLTRAVFALFGIAKW